MRCVQLKNPLPGTPTVVLIKGREISGSYMASGKVKRITKMANGDFRARIELDLSKRAMFNGITETWVVLSGEGAYAEVDETIYDMSEK